MIGSREPRRDPARPAPVRADAGPARAARHGRRAARIARGAGARARPLGRASSRCSRADGRPFQVPRGRVHDARAPLAREARGRSRRGRSTTPPSRAPEAQVVNDAVGRFALWGFPDAPDRKLLPPPGEVTSDGAPARQRLPRRGSSGRSSPAASCTSARRSRRPTSIAGSSELGDATRRAGRGRRGAHAPCCRRSSCRPPAFVLERDELALAAGLHNALFLVHPRAERWSVSDRQRRQIIDTALALVSQPLTHEPHARDGAPRAAPQPVSPHAQRHRRCRGGPAARGSRARSRRKRLTAWKGVRRVREDVDRRRLRRAARGARHRADDRDAAAPHAADPAARRASRRTAAALGGRGVPPARRRARARGRVPARPRRRAARAGRGPGAARRGVRADARARARRGATSARSPRSSSTSPRCSASASSTCASRARRAR